MCIVNPHKIYYFYFFVKGYYESFFRLSLNEFVTTETELKDIAADAIIGLRRGPPKR
jgi:hypothetical protein